jgi:hypothetical protein
MTQKTDQALARVEAILDDIDRLERELGTNCRQPSDLQAGTIVDRILRKLERVRDTAGEVK